MVALKPTSAGVRMLTLDGGGVRACMQLEILQALQLELGELPLQCFFDLMVGTSAGGIVALGLGVEDWRVDDCARKFDNLCAESFKRRKSTRLPGLSHLAILRGSSIYATSPIEAALQRTFTDEFLFGGELQRCRSRCKVAVISGTLSRAVVLSNYNRDQLSGGADETYDFLRPDYASDELKIWEAARATSAAPSYFESFTTGTSKLTLIDGALYHNNPIVVAERERRKLWPDLPGLPPLLPDLVISIGTGTTASPSPEPGNQHNSDRKTGFLDVFRRQHWVQVAHSIISSTTNAALAWDHFYRNQSLLHQKRYRRLNAVIEGQPPKLDDVSRLTELRSFTQAKLRDPSFHNEVRDIAQRLIASSFYFEPLKKSRLTAAGSCVIYGSIFCRLRPHSEEFRELGMYLDSRSTTNDWPYFVIQEVGKEQDSERV